MKNLRSKLNNKGFTIIELLAVVAIIAILFGSGITVVTMIIDNSKKKLYVNIANKYVNTAREAIAGNQFDISDPDTTYYIHINNFEMETSNGESPYGKFEDAYIVVGREPSEKISYEYAWVSKDEAGYRIDLEDIKTIDKKDVYQNKNRTLNNKAPLGTRTKVLIIDPTGNKIPSSPAVEMTRDEADKCYSYEFIETNKTVKITYYNVKSPDCGTDVAIPGLIDGYTVTEIYTYSFYNMGLTSVVIPGTVKKIGSNAFSNNKLTRVVLPEGLQTIDSEAFRNNKIPEVYFPDGLKSINARAFRSNQLTSYDIPNSVTTVGSCAFCDNPIPNPSFLYAKVNGADDYTTIRGYIGDLSEYPDKVFRIPAVKNGVALKKIENSAFTSMSLTDWEVQIPETVETVGASAFAYDGIAKVNMPPNLKTIGDSAFYSNRIQELHIPNTVTSIGTLAFNINQVTEGNGDIWIYKRTNSGIDYTTLIGYAGKNRSNIVIPGTAPNGQQLKTITSGAFRYLSLSGGVTIPNSVNNIENLAFALNNLSWIDNGDGDKTGPFLYKRKSSGGFDNSTLIQYAGYTKPSVTIPDNVKIIENYAFYYSYTYSVTIPEGVTKIGSHAFDLCRLSEVTIPSTVTSIGAGAFTKRKTWTSNNGSLTKIINKTGKSFDWKSITDGSEPATFETGIAKNWYGDIEITKR